VLFEDFQNARRHIGKVPDRTPGYLRHAPVAWLTPAKQSTGFIGNGSPVLEYGFAFATRLGVRAHRLYLRVVGVCHLQIPHRVHDRLAALVLVLRVEAAGYVALRAGDGATAGGEVEASGVAVGAGFAVVAFVSGHSGCPLLCTATSYSCRSPAASRKYGQGGFSFPPGTTSHPNVPGAGMLATLPCQPIAPRGERMGGRTGAFLPGRTERLFRITLFLHPAGRYGISVAL